MSRKLVLLLLGWSACGGGGGGGAGSSGSAGSSGGHGHVPQDASFPDGGGARDAAPPDAMPPDAFHPILCGDMGPTVMPIGLTGQTTGFVPGGMSRFAGSCGGGSSGELIFSLDVDRPLDALKFHMVAGRSAPNVALYVRTGCTDTTTEVQCATGATAMVTVPNPMMGQRYFVFVDGAESLPEGAFLMVADGTLPVGSACDPRDMAFQCGDGLLCAPGGDGGTTCRKPQCSDGMDNDGDGKTDFPNEPGCTSSVDDDEMNPTPLPGCSDGMDNDMDGMTDFPMDPDCTSAAGESEEPQCGPGIVVEDITAMPMVTAMTTGGSTLFTPPTGCGFSGATTPERIYLYRHSMAGRGLRISTENATTTLDTIVYVRKDLCMGPPLMGCSMGSAAAMCCDDDGGTTPSLSSIVEIPPGVAVPGNYFIFVDGSGSGMGPFVLTVTPF